MGIPARATEHLPQRLAQARAVAAAKQADAIAARRATVVLVKQRNTRAVLGRKARAIARLFLAFLLGAGAATTWLMPRDDAKASMQAVATEPAPPAPALQPAAEHDAEPSLRLKAAASVSIPQPINQEQTR